MKNFKFLTLLALTAAVSIGLNACASKPASSSTGASATTTTSSK